MRIYEDHRIGGAACRVVTDDPGPLCVSPLTLESALRFSRTTPVKATSSSEQPSLWPGPASSINPNLNHVYAVTARNPLRAVTIRAAVSVVACAFALVAVLSQNVASQGGSSRPLVGEARYEAWQTELSNWGRWGRDDQLGTLNLITPAKRRAALALVKEGVPVSLSTNPFFHKEEDVPCLAPGDRIFPDDLEAWEKRAGVKVGPGDALVLRWGRYGRRAKLGPDDGAAGFDNSILPWLKKRDVALIVWETAGYSPQPQG